MRCTRIVPLPAFILTVVFTLNHSQAQPAGFAVMEQGADWRVLSRSTIENGTNRVHQITELAAGLNYQNSYGQWVESKEQIDILPTGGAAAVQGQHKVYFPGDIYNGVIEVVTPDGLHLKSRPLGMSYDDGSNTVMIAVLTNSIGQLVGSNQVIYPDAFVGLKADLRYTYTRAGLEQDVILRRQPAAPVRFGLNAGSTRLQLLTEFFNTSDPTNTATTTSRKDGLRDASLKFGGMKLARGRAFSSADANPRNRLTKGTSVYKSWVRVGTRKFLVEQVPYPRIAVEMRTLPLTASTTLPSTGPKTSLASALPPGREPAAETNQMLVAATDFNRQPGVVLDYMALNNYYTSGDYTFQSNLTYYVSGYCEIDGALTIQGGTVVKYAPGADLYVGWVTCQTSPYNLATFTAVDDDSVGTTITGISTGTPDGYYASAALDFGNSDDLEQMPSLTCLRFCYAEVAIYNPGAETGFDLFNSQLIQCDIGVMTVWMNSTYKPNFSVRNVLIDQIGDAAFAGEDFDALVENVTLSGVNGGGASLADVSDDYANYSLNLINCLGRDNIYWGFNGDTLVSGTGCFSNLNAYAFQTSGAGNYYLANNSPYRNMGTASVDGHGANGPALLPYLRQTTTYPPVGISWDVNATTTLYPRVPRDTDTPDPGYHYPALDFLTDSLTVESGATLTLNYGAAIGLTSDSLTVNGTLVAGQQLAGVVYQEQPVGLMGVLVGGNSTVAYVDTDGDGLPNWWEQTYFGNQNQTSDGDPDGDGSSNLQEYFNGTDPNQDLGFTLRLGNQHFSQTNATGTFLVLNGVPSYEAVLVNSTNFSTATWSGYDGNIHLNLGPTDGVYQVWLGLKGYTTNSPPVWFGTKIYLDRVAPVVTITNPTNGTTAVPYLQVQGYSAEELLRVTYDLSNAVAVVTNQAGQLTGNYLDTNSLAYTTNYFQCYDILLTNGLNTITVHATDLAGNITTTNLAVTLDYASATNPVIQLIWPGDGSQLSCSNFTLRGWTDDTSATINAQITDTNGNTNVVSGMVERTGVLWVQNLPLFSGTNTLTLWVTNSAGLSSVTNISLVQSSLVLTMNPVTDSLWLPAVTVTGYVSDDTQAVWVNGVKATVTSNGNGTANWVAHNVPVTPGGVASFDMTAYGPTETQPDGSHGN